MKLQAISYNKYQSLTLSPKRKNTQAVQPEKKKNKVRDWLINFCIAWTIVDVIEDVWKWCNRKKPPFP